MGRISLFAELFTHLSSMTEHSSGTWNFGVDVDADHPLVRFVPHVFMDLDHLHYLQKNDKAVESKFI